MLVLAFKAVVYGFMSIEPAWLNIDGNNKKTLALTAFLLLLAAENNRIKISIETRYVCSEWDKIYECLILAACRAAAAVIAPCSFGPTVLKTQLPSGCRQGFAASCPGLGSPPGLQCQRLLRKSCCCH